MAKNQENSNENEYRIPISWSSIKFYEVKAKNLQEAVNKAVKQFFSEPDQNYIEDSCEIDENIIAQYEEDFDEDEAFEKLF